MGNITHRYKAKNTPFENVGLSEALTPNCKTPRISEIDAMEKD